MEGNFANPSALYAEAMVAKEALKTARAAVAEFVGAPHAKDIIFTASGTEANNLAVQGVYEMAVIEFQRSGLGDSEGQTLGSIAISRPHIVVTTIEHPAVLEVCRDIEMRGGEVTYLPVSEEGVVSARDVDEALRPNTVLVSVMLANNEIGTVQPIKEISRVIREWRMNKKTEFPYFHTDACQAAVHMPLNVLSLGVDMLTIDGLKMYGPRGIGALYVREEIQLRPIMFGGGQERGLRSGTENVPGIVGLARACTLASEMMETESARLLEIRNYGIKKILETFPQARLNGSQTDRLPNNINVCFPAMSEKTSPLDSEFAVISLDIAGISASYSSSCRTLHEDSSSYVITALGRSDCSESSLRFTLGRESTKEDMDVLVEELKKIVK